jgi:hypothetical protein
MPYIERNEKEMLAAGGAISNPGNLNYMISTLLIRYWKASPRNYQAINDILGAADGAKMEFYRRIAIPYEQLKREANGDIYPRL